MLGFDMLEIEPIYDKRMSAVVAAKTVFEMLLLN
jgi:arginase family enzyme